MNSEVCIFSLPLCYLAKKCVDPSLLFQLKQWSTWISNSINFSNLELLSTKIKIWIWFWKRVKLNVQFITLNQFWNLNLILGFRTPQNLNFLFMTLKLLSTKIKIWIFRFGFGTPIHKKWLFKFGSPNHKNQRRRRVCSL